MTNAKATKSGATSKKTSAKPKATEKVAASKKTAASEKKTVSKKASSKKQSTAALSPEQRYKMIEVAAYYLAEKNGFAGNPVDYWIAAEIQISE